VNIPAANDVTVSADISLPPIGSTHAGLIARYSGPGDSNMLLATIVHDDNGYAARIWRNVGGVWTLLNSAPLVTGIGHLVFDVQGGELVLHFGDLTLRALDTRITGLGQVGLRASNGVTFANFHADFTSAFAMDPFGFETPPSDNFNRPDNQDI